MSVPAKLWKHQFAWMHFSRVNFPLIWGKHWNPRRVSSRIHFSHQKVENVSAVTSWWSQGTGCGPPCPPSRLMHWRADPCWGSWAQHSWGGLCSRVPLRCSRLCWHSSGMGAVHCCRAGSGQGALGVWKELLWSAERSLLLHKWKPRLNLCQCFWLFN